VQNAAPMRVAVVDIGTNSTRLLIADVEDGRVTGELERHSQVTRLGKGVDANGSLNGEAMDRVFTTLNQYGELIDHHEAERKLAVLTSAVRDAANGREFADRVQHDYGLEPHVLTGEEEARLTYLGATGERDDGNPTLVVDIGGGSTEMVIGSGDEVTFHVSNQAGVVRQTERHLEADPPTEEELAALVADVREIFHANVPEDQRRAVRQAIAVAGTATQLAAIDQQLEPYDPKKVHGYVLSTAEIERLLEQLAAVPLEERRQTRGLDPDRAPTIVAGAAILLESARLFGLSEVEVSEHDILRGAALGL
jgi:exopolyphosphatase/guanosine-5'-triphosphate,3'-diphosphate pyrophosphatase